MFSLHMFVVIWPICKVMLACFAAVRSFTRVLPTMSLKKINSFTCENLNKVRYVKRYIYSENSFKPETLSTEFARKRHGSRMNAMVFSQRAFFSESSAANTALVWFVPRVNRFVLFQLQSRFKTKRNNFCFVNK